jgi:hypothetical protein
VTLFLFSMDKYLMHDKLHIIKNILKVIIKNCS